jgi:acetolactate synthase regulatory subunit
MLNPNDPDERERFEELYENAKLALTVWNKWSRKIFVPLEKQTEAMKRVMHGIIASKAAIDEKEANTTLTADERRAVSLVRNQLSLYEAHLEQLHQENSTVLREVKEFEVTFINLDLKMKKYKRSLHPPQRADLETLVDLRTAYRSTGQRIGDFFKRTGEGLREQFTREGILRNLDAAIEGAPIWVDQVNAGLDLLESVKDQHENWHSIHDRISGGTDSWDNSASKRVFDNIFEDAAFKRGDSN